MKESCWNFQTHFNNYIVRTGSFQEKQPKEADKIRGVFFCETVKNANGMFHKEKCWTQEKTSPFYGDVFDGLKFKFFELCKSDDAENNGSHTDSCTDDTEDETCDRKTFHKITSNHFNVFLWLGIKSETQPPQGFNFPSEAPNCIENG